MLRLVSTMPLVTKRRARHTRKLCKHLCKVDDFALRGEWEFMGVVASVGVEGFGQRRKERTREDKSQKPFYLQQGAFTQDSHAHDDPWRH
jgi:hypothetical protein